MKHEFSHIWILVTIGLCLAHSACRTVENKQAESTFFTQDTFANADADSDGKLTQVELAVFLHQEALAEFDLNSDEKIAASEWSAARPTKGESDPHFMALDQNGDNHVEEKEAVQFITTNESFIDQFERFDTNDDAGLHWEEVEAASPESLNLTLFSETQQEPR